MLFVDITEAYDSVKPNKVTEAMEEFGISAKLQRLMIMTIKKTRCNVRTKGGKLENFIVKTGLPQEDPFSTILFNMVLEKTSSKLNRNGDNA